MELLKRSIQLSDSGLDDQTLSRDGSRGEGEGGNAK